MAPASSSTARSSAFAVQAGKSAHRRPAPSPGRALGYQRWSQQVTVLHDQKTPVNIVLEKYDAPVEDETLSKWGRNFMLIGIIGGGLGIGGPFAYQKVILHRDPFSQLGPKDVGPGASGTYRGPLPAGDPNIREDPTHKTLKTIQFWSVIGGERVHRRGARLLHLQVGPHRAAQAGGLERR